MNAPHYPYQGTAKWLEPYSELEYPRKLYAALLFPINERIGKLLRKVDDLGLREHTIGVFQSDQRHSSEVRAHGGGGNSGPYRGGKGSLCEGGIRVPAISSWPGHLPQSEVRDQMCTSCDWYPTILGPCKLPAAQRRPSGKTLLPVVVSAEAPFALKGFYWKLHHK